MVISLSVRFGASLMDDDFLAPLVVLIVAILIGAILILVIKADNAKVDHKIEQCLAAGGSPIVVGHQYTTEFKACQMP